MSADDLHRRRGTRAVPACSSVSSASSVMPMMPFIGVRISWLMLARNSLLARLASIARSRAATSSALLARSSAVRASTACSRSSWCCSSLVALLDLAQHLVEAGDQLADLVVAFRAADLADRSGVPGDEAACSVKRSSGPE